MKKQTFSEILKEKRETAGITQAEASRKLFISRSSYYHYEAGTRTPSLEIMLRISELYQIDPFDLLASIMPDNKPEPSILSAYNSLPQEAQVVVKQLIEILHR